LSLRGFFTTSACEISNWFIPTGLFHHVRMRDFKLVCPYGTFSPPPHARYQIGLSLRGFFTGSTATPFLK
jgi:hypothetical protein